MKICQPHWEELKAAIKAKGLFDMVATENEIGKIVEGELKGEKKTVKNFDPLLAANNMLWSNALQTGGIYLMGRDKQGNEYCPVCEAEKHGQKGWIQLAANGVAEFAKTLPPDEDQPGLIQ